MKIPDKAVIRFEYSDENREYIFDIKELYDIIKEKQQRIDNVIKYLEDNTRYSVLSGMVEFYGSSDEVIDILKGSDKE